MENEIVTADFSKFGHREREMATELLNAMSKQGLPKDFYGENVSVSFNTHSGNVFLTNEDYQVAMMNGDDLESWYYCGECGHEGFKEDMQHEGNSDCQKYLNDIGVENND